MAKITKAEVTQVFNGQSDIIVFAAPTAGYSKTSTFADVTDGGVSLGQVVQDSTEWTGEEATVENILDEQGDVIVAQPTKGTFGFSCEIANVSQDNLVKFLKAVKVTAAITSEAFASVKNLTKVGDEMPVVTCPIAITNDEANKFILFPKAKVIAGFNLDSKLWRIKIQVTAESIDTPNLGTFMMGEGVPQYDDAA